MINKRVWLNPENSSSTGSVVVYSGESNYPDRDGNFPNVKFVEIADCQNKICLQKTHKDSDQDFIEKVKLLRNTLTEFIEALSTPLKE